MSRITVKGMTFNLVVFTAILFLGLLDVTVIGYKTRLKVVSSVINVSIRNI